MNVKIVVASESSHAMYRLTDYAITRYRPGDTSLIA